MFDLTGKRALVTGGSRGIGAALCRVLVREGASVAINYHRSPAEAEALAAALGDRAVAVGGDVSVEAEVVRMVRTAADQLGGLDILIGNAGVIEPIAHMAEAGHFGKICISVSS